MSNNTHVTDVGRLLHETVDLIDREAAERKWGRVSKIPSSRLAVVIVSHGEMMQKGRFRSSLGQSCEETSALSLCLSLALAKNSQCTV